MKKLLLAAAAAVIMLSGCAISNLDPDAQFAMQYAFQKVTGELVENDPEKAERVRAIAAEVRAYADREELLTVDALLGVIRAEVNWDNLDAADTSMVNYLLDRWRRSLVERFGEDAVAEDLRVSVATVTEWVILAARP